VFCKYGGVSGEVTYRRAGDFVDLHVPDELMSHQLRLFGQSFDVFYQVSHVIVKDSLDQFWNDM